MNADDFYQGYISGLTVYAAAMGQSTLKSENELLTKLMDEGKQKAVDILIHEQETIAAKVTDVYYRPECIFNYCPYAGTHEETCKRDDRCMHPGS